MNVLFDRIYGALIGSAIGDAMGGPVEGLHYSEIAERFGRVETLLPYDHVTPSYHGPFYTRAGSYTDDTRLALLFARAIIHAGGPPQKGDLTHVMAEYYFNARTEMERGFIEEYYLKGVYGEPKELFGGRPTNGGIMGIAPLGAIFPCDPEAAFSSVFQNLFISTGTARSASAFAAAMIAAAMKPGADWHTVLSDAFIAADKYKKSLESAGWRNSELYPIVAVKTESMVREVSELGSRAESVYSINSELYEAVVQPFFADASESLAIAAAMFTAAKGDFELTVKGCVNFGRDNDSSAAVGGAVAGALCGASGIPQEWIDSIETANPPLTASFYSGIRDVAEVLTGLTMRNNKKSRRNQMERDSQFFGIRTEEKDFSLPELSEGKSVELFAALAGGSDPDRKNDKGKTALHISAASGWNEGVSILLLYGADPDIRDNRMTTPLHFAVWENNPQCINLLLEHGADPDLSEGCGWTPLHDGLRREYMDIVLTLLSKSRNVPDIQAEREKISDTSGDARFCMILGILSENQVALDSTGICGQSLLHDAVESNYVESVKYLLRKGADPNRLATSLGEIRFEGTPLHKAAAFGNSEIYRLLISAGGDETIGNIDGKTPPELRALGEVKKDEA